MWIVIEKVLLFSHGNAQVENGFLINKDTVVENLQEARLISQRIAFDAVTEAGGPLSVIIIPLMAKVLRCARQKYRCSSEAKKIRIKTNRPD